MADTHSYDASKKVQIFFPTDIRDPLHGGIGHDNRLLEVRGFTDAGVEVCRTDFLKGFKAQALHCVVSYTYIRNSFIYSLYVKEDYELR